VVDPSKIILIPYAFPESYEGGKQTAFITHHSQYSPKNPNKPDILCMPVPITERDYNETIHMLNGTLTKFAVKKSDRPEWQRKWSSWQFYESIMGRESLSYVETMHRTRDSYHKCVGISHVAHLGPRSFLDQTTGQWVEYEGFGPGNARSMNVAGAESVFHQITQSFPR
jgi:hypothetical protein